MLLSLGMNHRIEAGAFSVVLLMLRLRFLAPAKSFGDMVIPTVVLAVFLNRIAVEWFEAILVCAGWALGVVSQRD